MYCRPATRYNNGQIATLHVLHVMAEEVYGWYTWYRRQQKHQFLHSCCTSKNTLQLEKGYMAPLYLIHRYAMPILYGWPRKLTFRVSQTHALLLLRFVPSLCFLLLLCIFPLSPLVLLPLLLLSLQNRLLLRTQFGRIRTATACAASMCVLRVDDDSHWSLCHIS